MIQTLQVLLSILIMISLAFTVFFSFRYRRQTDARLRGLFQARMNICMGIMLILIAVSQLFFFQDTAMRRFFGTVCLLLGLFNLYSGIRSHSHFGR